MKKLVYLVLAIIFTACSNTPTETYDSFGQKISSDGIESFASLDQALENQDSVRIKISGEIDEICQMKGCWMTLKAEEDTDPVRVTFKDYGFFVPKDAHNRKTILEGVAVRETLSEDKARHYAEDAGVPFDSTKTYTEISFVADGVLIASIEDQE